MMTSLILFLVLAALGSVKGSAPATSAASNMGAMRRRRIQSTQCGQSQCYIEKYGQCFHATSYECTTMKDEAQQGGMVAAPPSTATAGSDEDEDDKWIKAEVPALFQMLNVDEDYSLSPLDRARILSKVRSMVEEVLDDSSSQIISVESPGEYIGSRRLQSSLLRRGGSERRLNKTLYLPIVVTVRVREDMVGMISIFLLQVLRDRLSEMMEYLKTLNASAFRNAELSVKELDLSNVDTQSTSTNTSTNTSTSSSTNTNSNSSSSTSTTTSTTKTKNKGSKSNGTPAWVWVIVALVLIPLFFCLLLCMCRAGWCLCCTGKNKEEDDYESQKQVAIERWRKEPVQKLGDDTSRVGAVRFGNSVGSRPDRSSVYERRRRHEGRRVRRNGDRRRVVRRRRRQRRPSTSSHSNMTYETDRSSIFEMEIEREKMSIIEEKSKLSTENGKDVAASSASLSSTKRGRDPSVQYQTALVVYDDEKIRFALDPEAPKIDELPNPRGDEVVVFNPNPNPPREPEGVSVVAEIPQTVRKSSRQQRPRPMPVRENSILTCPPKNEKQDYQRSKSALSLFSSFNSSESNSSDKESYDDSDVDSDVESVEQR